MRLPSFKPITILDKKTERTLLLKSSRGDREARNFLIENNQFLVLKIANLYRCDAGVGVDFEDMIQEGNVGLIKAVDRFKVRKNVRLSTYATYWIHQRIGRFIMERGRLVHLPVNLQYKFYKAVKKLSESETSKISKAQQSSFSGLNQGSDITKDSDLSHYPQSIDDVHMIHALKCRNVELEKLISILDIEKYLERVVGIDEVQKKIIKLHIGLYDSPRDFVEIGKILNEPSSRVRGWYERAIFTLRGEMAGSREVFEEDLCI